MRKTHFEPIPRNGGLPFVLRYMQRALVQPGVQEVRVTVKGLEVVREMPEGEEVVVPQGSNDIDYDHLLGNIELLTHPFSEEHGTEALFYAAQELFTERKVQARWMLIPGWTLTSAWLGVERLEPPATVYGLQAVYVPPASTNRRVILLGAPESLLWVSDATAGIAIDIGV